MFKSRYSIKDINELLEYLNLSRISPKDAIQIIHSTTPQGKETNKKFNWKMMRFTLYVWQRLEEETLMKNLNTKTESAILTVGKRNYKNLYEGFHDEKIGDGIAERKEALNLFKLVTDPRQREWFKPRYFLYPKTKTTIPQEHIDQLMQWPKNTS